MIILGIETSCDETAASLLEVRGIPRLRSGQEGQGARVLSNIVSSQVKIHAKYGGIVPEVAARKHVEMMVPVLEQALAPLGRRQWLLSPTDRGIDLIAVTNGPGLITSLMVGVETAKTLAFAWDKPIVAVNHLAGHFWSWQLPQKNIQYPMTNVQFPILGLVVSGGHTELVLVKDYEKYQVVGQTIDDAAGEAFDKVAKILGLGYPGGPIISRLAEQGSPTAFDFPRPMMKSSDFNFSFAGLKTSVLYKVRDLVGAKSVGDNACPDRSGGNYCRPGKTRGEDDYHRLPKGQIYDLCASFQQAAVDVLVAKTVRAAKKYQVNTVVLGGGVAANKLLRKTMGESAISQLPDTRFLIPDTQYCMDNAAMIALAGYHRFKTKGADDFRILTVDPNLRLA